MKFIHVHIMHRFKKNSNITKCIQAYAMNCIMSFWIFCMKTLYMSSPCSHPMISFLNKKHFVVRDIVLDTSRNKFLEFSRNQVLELSRFKFLNILEYSFRTFQNQTLEPFRNLQRQQVELLLETSELDNFIGLKLYIGAKVEEIYSLDNALLRVLPHISWC